MEAGCSRWPARATSVRGPTGATLSVPARSGPFRAFRPVRPDHFRCTDALTASRGPGPRTQRPLMREGICTSRGKPPTAPQGLIFRLHRIDRTDPGRPSSFEPAPGPDAGRGAARREAGPIFSLPKRRGPARAGTVWRSFVPRGFRPTGSGRRGCSGSGRSARIGRGTTSTPAQ